MKLQTILVLPTIKILQYLPFNIFCIINAGTSPSRWTAPYGPSRSFLPASPRGSASLPSLFAHFLHRLASKSNLKLPDSQTDDGFLNWKVSCRQWLTNCTHCLPLWYCGRNLAMSETFFGTSGNFFFSCGNFAPSQGTWCCHLPRAELLVSPSPFPRPRQKQGINQKW